MATGSRLMTADQLLLLPRGGTRHELVKGELRTMTPSGHVHGKVAARVAARLVSFVEEHDLGLAYGAETGFILRRSPDTVRAPDAAFVTAARLAAMSLSPHGYFPGAPDLAVEVTSPSDTRGEVDEQVAAWLEAGCRVVVVLEPERKVATVYRPGDVRSLGISDHLSLPDLLPGWSAPLEELFR
ncbi:MAG: Uma2 family endonuclease [Vicinamibacterales bacterium]